MNGPVIRHRRPRWHESLADVLITLFIGLILTSPIWGCVLALFVTR